MHLQDELSCLDQAPDIGLSTMDRVIPSFVVDSAHHTRALDLGLYPARLAPSLGFCC